MATDDGSDAPGWLSADRLVTPGIVRSSSGGRCALTIDEADCTEKSSSFDGKFAQMMVQIKINPAAEMEFVTVFPDCF